MCDTASTLTHSECSETESKAFSVQTSFASGQDLLIHGSWGMTPELQNDPTTVPPTLYSVQVVPGVHFGDWSGSHVASIMTSLGVQMLSALKTSANMPEMSWHTWSLRHMFLTSLQLNIVQSRPAGMFSP